jgi:putative glutamine amidotransferase
MADPTSFDPAPRVLITRAEEVVGEDWQDYVRCIERAGGEAVPFDCSDFRSIPALPPFDGILITAGVDIDPARYRQQRSDRVGEIDPDRDTVEAILIQHALDATLPLFAICRGFQLLNVTRGGSLLQHIEDREPHRARLAADGVTIESGWHDVTVRPNSLLADITGGGTIRTNSRHHQAVLSSGLAPDILATGIGPDDVIEAIEIPGHGWALGVQWHPERPDMTDVPWMQSASTALFESFVAACAGGVRGDA